MTPGRVAIRWLLLGWVAVGGQVKPSKCITTRSPAVARIVSE